MPVMYEPRMLSGRCANGAQRDGGKLVHAMYAPASSFDPAVCGARPGRLSGAGFCEVPVGSVVTCKRCLKLLKGPGLRVSHVLPAAEQLLRAVAAGKPHTALPDLDKAVHRQISSRGWLIWWSATGARLTPAGEATLARLDAAQALQGAAHGVLEPR